MRWDRVSALLAGVRTSLLILLGLAAIVYGVFLIYVPAGFIVLGVGLFLVEALTQPEKEVARR